MDAHVIVRESFSLFYGGSQLFSMELDGLGDKGALVMEKFARDVQFLRRPSAPSLTGVHLKDTSMTEEMIKTMLESMNASGMHIQKAAVIGLKASGRRMFSRLLKSMSPPARFVCAFYDDYEKAKEWLVK